MWHVSKNAIYARWSRRKVGEIFHHFHHRRQDSVYSRFLLLLGHGAQPKMTYSPRRREYQLAPKWPKVSGSNATHKVKPVHNGVVN